jgi:hypothetical protein
MNSTSPLVLLAGGALVGACTTYFLTQKGAKRGTGEPIGLLVTVEIKPELVEQFKTAIEIDAVGKYAAW